jgi:hypothetical protein
MGFGLVIGFIGLFMLSTTSNNNSSWIYTVYNSLWHTLRLFSLLFLDQSSGMTSKGRYSPSFGFMNCPCALATVILG